MSAGRQEGPKVRAGANGEPRSDNQEISGLWPDLTTTSAEDRQRVT
jgi:hypothetical protein